MKNDMISHEPGEQEYLLPLKPGQTPEEPMTDKLSEICDRIRSEPLNKQAHKDLDLHVSEILDRMRDDWDEYLFLCHVDRLCGRTVYMNLKTHHAFSKEMVEVPTLVDHYVLGVLSQGVTCENQELYDAEEFNFSRCSYCGNMEAIRNDDPNRKQHVWEEDDRLCPGPEIDL